MDITPDELETIRRALCAFRIGLIHKRLPSGSAIHSEPHIQYDRAGHILQKIESINQFKGSESRT